LLPKAPRFFRFENLVCEGKWRGATPDDLGVASIWQRIHSTADPGSYLLVYVDPFSPKSLPIKFSPGRPEQGPSSYPAF